MAAPSTKAESTAFGDRLRRIFSRDVPMDDAARAAIARMDEAQQHIERVRQEVTSGIRRRDGRFHL